jgi:hypothetical protein
MKMADKLFNAVKDNLDGRKKTTVNSSDLEEKVLVVEQEEGKIEDAVEIASLSVSLQNLEIKEVRNDDKVNEDEIGINTNFPQNLVSQDETTLEALFAKRNETIKWVEALRNTGLADEFNSQDVKDKTDLIAIGIFCFQFCDIHL